MRREHGKSASRQNGQRKIDFHYVASRNPEEIENRHVINQLIKIQRRVCSERQQQGNRRDGCPKLCARVRLQRHRHYREHDCEYADVTSHLRIKWWSKI